MNTPTTPPAFSWKGKSFTQIYAAIKQNKNDPATATAASFRRAQPLKLYRREIVITPDPDGTCSEQRHATKIDALMMPQGATKTAADPGTNLVVTVDVKDTEHGGQACDAPANTCYISTEYNARRRVRSCGFVKPTYHDHDIKRPYSANYQQYLQRRAKTFSQNQFCLPRDDGTVTVAQGSLECPEPRTYHRNAGQTSSAQTVRMRTCAESECDVTGKLFPIRQYPVFPTHTDTMRTCQHTKL
jgi:hypothetical protein